MAVERIGSIGVWKPATAATGSTSVSVPTDAEIMVVAVVTYGGVSNYLADGSVTINAAALSVGRAGDSSTSAMQGCVWYKVFPSTGTQTLAFVFADAPAEAFLFLYAFYKGLNTSSPIRSSGGQQIGSGNATTGSMTAQAGDKAVVFGWVYSYAIQSGWWTNATQQAADINSSSSGALAEADPSAPITVTIALPTDGGIAGIVLAVAAGGGLSIPVAMHYNKMRTQ